jgi:hypothetical protein
MLFAEEVKGTEPQAHPAITPASGALYDPATGESSDVLFVLDRPQFYGIDPEMKTPRTDQLSVGLDREPGRDMVFGVTYSRKLS